MHRFVWPMAALLVAGCSAASFDPYQRPGTWHPAGDNDANLHAMIVNPHDLVEGEGQATTTGAAAAPPVTRLVAGKRFPLPSMNASTIDQPAQRHRPVRPRLPSVTQGPAIMRVCRLIVLSVAACGALSACAPNDLKRPSKLSAETRLQVAEAADAAGNSELAIAMYTAAAESKPANIAVQMRCADALARSGKIAQARQFLAERLRTGAASRTCFGRWRWSISWPGSRTRRSPGSNRCWR